MDKEISFSESFEEQMRLMSQQTVLSPGYRKKKLILWVVRTCITVALYIIFWEYAWVRWTLLVVAPLSIMSLVMIVGMNYFLQRKIAVARQKMGDVDKLIAQDNRTERE